MRKNRDGTRNKQDWSAQDYRNQRLPPLTLLLGNVKTQRHTLAALASTQTLPDCVRRKVDVAVAALTGLESMLNTFTKQDATVAEKERKSTAQQAR